MTRRILKWTIPVDDHDHPIGAGPVVHVDVQGNDTDLVQVWTDEDDAGDIQDAGLARVYATGQPVPPGDEVLGTVLVLGGSLVWHVVRRRPIMPRREYPDAMPTKYVAGETLLEGAKLGVDPASGRLVMLGRIEPGPRDGDR